MKTILFIYKVIIFLIFPPVLSFIYFFIEYIKKRRVLIFSLVMTIFLTNVVPMFDLVHTYKNFQYLKQLEVVGIFKIGLYHRLYYELYKLNFDFSTVYILAVFIIVLLWNKTFLNLKIDRRKIVFFYIIFWTTLYYRLILDLTRYTMGMVIFCYILYTAKKYRTILLLLPICFHIALIIPYFLYILSIAIAKWKRTGHWLILIGVMIMLLKINENLLVGILVEITKNIMPSFSKKLDLYYLSRTISINYSEFTVSVLINYLLMVISSIFSIISLFFLLIKRESINNFQRNNIIFLILLEYLCFICYDNFILFERMFILLKLVFICCILDIFRVKINKIIGITILIFLVHYFYNIVYYYNIYYINKDVSSLKKGYSGTERLKELFYKNGLILLKNRKFTDEWLERWKSEN